MTHLKACIFDLDGVIVHTSQYHFLAWKRMAKTMDHDLTEEENKSLKGLSRLMSINKIAEMAGTDLTDDQRDHYMQVKNEWYLELVKNLNQEDALPGVIQLIRNLRTNNIKVGLGSASKNARLILNHLQITDLFDTIVDGTNTTRSKPDPQVFEMGAEQLGVKSEECVVFEDSVAGLKAANSAGFITIGIGDSETLHSADAVISGFENFTLDQLNEIVAR